ncbi:hypothetical protein H5410_002655 [Solanum commersonii]|uniref:CCHC-type domain-containing protein n=1 Tax=Solanum commersonii TaxID=4109 RepID=A0A9J6B2X6_SOLCO|nr:hypothetical protein H5410_002655 [Solanum commersonii]
MLMYATICKSVNNIDRTICKMIIACFTGKLRGWWDNYISVEAKVVFTNAKAASGRVDNLGFALVKNKEDVVYTLVLTILEHFNGRFTNQYETVCSLLNSLCCRHLGEFHWCKDTYKSRVMELPENSLEHWKAKFIDGLPPLLAEIVKKNLWDAQGVIPYGAYTYDTSKGKKTKHKDSSDSTPDKPCRKKSSRRRSREEREERELSKIKCCKCGKFGHIAPNCRLEKLKSLELDEAVHNKVYSFLYSSGFESDYESDADSEEDIDLPESSDINKQENINACRYRDLNINTITSANVIELLKEVTDNNLREKIIQLAVNNNAMNNRLAKQPVIIRDTSFDDLKGEIENLKNEIKSIKQNQMIYDHRFTQIETATSKGKSIDEDNTNAMPIKI